MSERNPDSGRDGPYSQYTVTVPLRLAVQIQTALTVLAGFSRSEESARPARRALDLAHKLDDVIQEAVEGLSNQVPTR